jgi:tetratricopeptide (TPR) repeat protein
MAFMKKIGLSLVLVVLLVVTATALYAQDYSALQQAFSKSYTYEDNGEYNKAIEELKNVYDEDSYEINLRLGWLTYLSGSFTESAAYYQRAITLMPMSIEARLGYALPASALGNWDLVIKKYEQILAIDPYNSLVNYRLASIYHSRQEYQKAYEYLEKVANHYPYDYDITILFAWTNFYLGKLREAKVLFNKTLLIRPGDSSAQEGLKLIQ